MDTARNLPSISVIIPTLADKPRRESLHRAIDSVLGQQQVAVTVIVVANGRRYDKAVITELANRRDILFQYLEEGSLPGAQHFGRQQVKTDYFSFLDDDDTYLADTLRLRVMPMLEDPSIDVTVANGIKEIGTHKITVLENIQEIQKDPLDALLDRRLKQY